MRIHVSLAAAAILVCASHGFALAQNAPDSAGAAAPATTPPSAAAPASAAPPATAAAPAAQSATSPPASPPSANAPAAADSSTKDGAIKDSSIKDSTQKSRKKKTAGTTPRHEVEKSIESGTVPSRYRSSVPKEYQQYIPFSKD